MQRDQLALLLAGLGELTGIEGLETDASGSCTLVVDDADVAVSIVHDDTDGSLRLMSALPELELDEPRLLSLLQANYLGGQTDGAVFAVDPATGTVVLTQTLGATIDPQELAVAMESFVGAVVRWQDELQSPPIEEDEDEPSADPDSPAMGVRV